jgi:hypothetical protein
MTSSKDSKLKPEQQAVLMLDHGQCMATDKITVAGAVISYMYRENPNFEFDSGWRFFSGKETQANVNNPRNSGIHEVNTIANNDRAIIPYLQMLIGTELVRKLNSNEFREV